MTSKHLIPDPGDDEVPELAALTKQQRIFVLALMDDPQTHGAPARAARTAGYAVGGKPGSVHRAANRCFNNPAVIAAISALARKRLRAEAPAALQAVREILHDKDHKDRLKAARTVLERIDPTEQRLAVDLNVTDEREDRDALPLQLLERFIKSGMPRSGLVEWFGYSGISHFEDKLRAKCEREGRPYPTGPKLIEATAVETSADTQITLPEAPADE